MSRDYSVADGGDGPEGEVGSTAGRLGNAYAIGYAWCAPLPLLAPRPCTRTSRTCLEPGGGRWVPRLYISWKLRRKPRRPC